jgi:hypothetical protein
MDLRLHKARRRPRRNHQPGGLNSPPSWGRFRLNPPDKYLIECTMTFVGKHGHVVAHFDEADFNQGP